MQFHFVFHRIADLPEALVAGKERIYLEHFFNKLSLNRAAVDREAVDVYVDAYSRPGAFRAAFNTYRAFERDMVENLEWIGKYGKCRVKCLCLSGDMSRVHADEAMGMAEEMFEGDTRVSEVEAAGHYVAEENPESFVEDVLKFIGRD